MLVSHKLGILNLNRNISVCLSISPTITKILSFRTSQGMFAVSSGFGVSEIVTKFKENHDDFSAILAEALADRLVPNQQKKKTKNKILFF